MELSKLSPPRGSKKSRVRVGRGESSGLGKTSGKGGKGQTARTGGGVRPGFEGGQMPLYRRIPKIGFVSRQRVFGTNQFVVVNLNVLEDKFAAGSKVDPDAVYALGIDHRSQKKAGLKVLATGELTKKLTVSCHAISAAARAKIEAAGGTVEIIVAKK